MTRRVVSLSAWIGAAALLCAWTSAARADDDAPRALTADPEQATLLATPTLPGSPVRGTLAERLTAAQRAAAEKRAAAQRAAGVAATTTDGSVLRLVAGQQGIAPDPTEQLLAPIPPGDPTLPSSPMAMPPSPVMPPSVAQSLDPDNYAAGSQSAPRFTNPHEAIMADSYAETPARGRLFHLPPPGIIPIWGPRTSEQDRFIGWGQPLYGASWLNRPLGAGWFAGALQGSSPIRGHVGQHSGFFGGFRLTWDYDYYYGLEFRLGGGAIGLKYPGYDYPTATSDLYVADVNVLYYPLGDARWRPFITAGVGTTKISFFDREDAYYGAVLVSTPVGLGVKYRFREWLALRGEVIDNVAFGRGPFSTMNNISYTAGVEVRFGGLRKSYFPWHPSRQIW